MNRSAVHAAAGVAPSLAFLACHLLSARQVTRTTSPAAFQRPADGAVVPPRQPLFCLARFSVPLQTPRRKGEKHPLIFPLDARTRAFPCNPLMPKTLQSRNASEGRSFVLRVCVRVSSQQWKHEADELVIGNSVSCLSVCCQRL